MERILDLTVRGTTEQREDSWVIKCLELGIIVYGSTEEEANESFAGAVETLVNSFGENYNVLTAWQERKQLDYRFSSSPEVTMAGTIPDHAPIPFEERMRVAVGAPA